MRLQRVLIVARCTAVPAPGQTACIAIRIEGIVQDGKRKVECILREELSDDQRLRQLPRRIRMHKGGNGRALPVVVMVSVEVQRSKGVSSDLDQSVVPVVVVVQHGGKLGNEILGSHPEAIPRIELVLHPLFLFCRQRGEACLEVGLFREAVDVGLHRQGPRTCRHLRCRISPVDGARAEVDERLDVRHRHMDGRAPSELLAHPFRLVEDFPSDDCGMSLDGVDHRDESVVDIVPRIGRVSEHQLRSVRHEARVGGSVQHVE